MASRIEIQNPIDFRKMNESMQRGTEAALLKQVELEKTEIILRTQRGEDADGRAFDDYSPAYKERKGRFVNNLSNSWLKLTGGMLASLTTKSERLGRGIFVASIYPLQRSNPGVRFPPKTNRKRKQNLKPLKAVSAADKVRWNDAIRPFFRWSELQITRMARAVSDSFKEL